MLGAVIPEVPQASLADWPIGSRNRALAEWLSASVGPGLAGCATCEQCGEKLEFELDARALLETEPTDPDARAEIAGHVFALPTSRDLVRVARADEPHDPVTCLLESCRLDQGDPLALSQDEVDELGELLALGDPLAETRLTLSCPECEADWVQTLDLTAFAWAEIESRARRLLLEVHLLASAYGWSEDEVLAVSAPRRAFYLEAAGG
jgi:hypothetical protein